MASDLAVPQCGQVMIDWWIMVAFSKLETGLEHISDVRTPGRIGEHGRLQVIGRQAVADRQTKQIDHVLDVRPDEMRAENTALSSSIIVLYPYTVSATRRAVYQSGTLAAFPRSFAPCPRAAPSESPTAAIGGSVKATLGTPR